MAVYDRWHLTHPPPDAVPCRCSRGKTKLYPNPNTHEKGDRWQVRWDVVDPETGKRRQPRRNFPKKEGKDPNTCAEAFDAKIRAEINSGTYTDPDAGTRPFKAYAEEVLANRAVEDNTRHDMRLRFERHVYAAIGGYELRVLAKRPSLVQGLIRRMERAGLAADYIGLIMANVETVFTCAVDDSLIAKNPVAAKSVTLPPVTRKKVVPWTAEQAAAMREHLPDRVKAMVDVAGGLGLRQGEVLGLSPGDVDWLSPEPVVHVRRQVKWAKRRTDDGKTRRAPVFALPKYRKTREVPLPESVKVALAEHLRAHPAVEVSLPWRSLDGDPVTVPLFFPRAGSAKVVDRDSFSQRVWRPALERAGIVAAPKKGERRKPARQHGMHALRHYFASMLLTEGESVQAVSEWLGHSKPSITWDIYAHLMPKSQTRMRKIIDAAMEPAAGESPPKTGDHQRS
jgi:integrase